MLSFARTLFVVSVVTAIFAVASRFVQPNLILAVLPVTWLKVTALLLLGSVAASLLEIAENLPRK